MPDWLAVIILGIVEGITEFLPISSTGHLIIFEKLFHELPSRLQSEAFLVGIQGGAVLAVIVVFKERLREMMVKRKDPETREYVKKLVFAFVFTGIFGLALKKMGWELPENVAPIAWALVAGGVMFLFVEKKLKTKINSYNSPNGNQITWTIALAFGVAQLVAAVFPGASRSGTTIIAGLLLGMKRSAAVEFSFLLGVPTLLAASSLEIATADGKALAGMWKELLLGITVSAITAFISVKWLLRYVQTHTFESFGWYRIVIGGLILYALWIH